MQKKVLIIAESYPNKSEPEFTFVQQLAKGLTKRKIKVTVIAPQSITKLLFRGRVHRPVHWIDYGETGENYIDIYQPYFFSFSNTNCKVLNKIAYFSHLYATSYIFKKHKINTDVVYSYFWHIGIENLRIFKDTIIPVYVQASECNITLERWMHAEKYINKVAGVVCASEKNRIESISANLVSLNNTKLIVNGYDANLFYKEEKNIVRKKYCIPADAFVVIFVGGFIERKGPARIAEAINRCNGDIFSIFIGKGDNVPHCKNILFCGLVEHKNVVHYLNCADVFVLPTLAEGCCNAIIEALACGLPIISSNMSFNDEIIDYTCSIRINPNNVDGIKEAIMLLKSNPFLREKLAEGALKKVKNFSIEKRTELIDDYLFSNKVW